MNDGLHWALDREANSLILCNEQSQSVKMTYVCLLHGTKGQHWKMLMKLILIRII
jgi:hypothetical protein